jgi:hypothetical protein
MEDDLLGRLGRLRGGAAAVDNGEIMAPCTVLISSGESLAVHSHGAVINRLCEDLQCSTIRVVTCLELSRRRVEGSLPGCTAVSLLWDLFAVMRLFWQTPSAVRNVDIGVPSDRMHNSDLEAVKNAAASLLHVWIAAVHCPTCRVHLPDEYCTGKADERILVLHALTRRLARAAWAVDRQLKAGQDRVAWLIVAKRRGVPRDVAKLVLRWIPLEIHPPEEYLRRTVESVATARMFINRL